MQTEQDLYDPCTICPQLMRRLFWARHAGVRRPKLHRPLAARASAHHSLNTATCKLEVDVRMQPILTQKQVHTHMQHSMEAQEQQLCSLWAYNLEPGHGPNLRGTPLVTSSSARCVPRLRLQTSEPVQCNNSNKCNGTMQSSALRTLVPAMTALDPAACPSATRHGMAHGLT